MEQTVYTCRDAVKNDMTLNMFNMTTDNQSALNCLKIV